jgi:hypothetical protein
LFTKFGFALDANLALGFLIVAFFNALFDGLETSISSTTQRLWVASIASCGCFAHLE